MNEQFLINQANYLIIGKKGSAKTCLGMCLLKTINEVSKRKAYVYRFPQPKLLKKLPFKVENINNLNQLFQLTDSVVFVDEASISFPSLEKKINEQLRNLLTISRQNNCCYILACHNSYFLNRSLFSFIDIRLIKEVNPNHWELERTYMKKLYENVHIYGPENFFIDSDYLRGEQCFEKPEWFIEELSNAYKKGGDKKGFFQQFKVK